MSDVTTEIERPAFGPQGEPCANCGARLARDQRYCLECGTRRAGMGALLAAPRERVRETTVVSEPAAAAGGPWHVDAAMLTGVGCLLLALLVGVLIGRSGGSGDGAQRASAPQVVTVGGVATAAPGTGAAATASFTSDWPAGKRGFTVQLQLLPKSGTDAAAVAAAKRAASAKGAPAVGALDSDVYKTLPGGRYVVFSGQYADRKAAAAALKKLHGFAGAKVVEVREKNATTASRSSSKASSQATGKTKQASAAEQAAGAKAIQDIQSASGKDYSKKSAKLPDKLATPGTPPPTDTSKPAGGGSATETFK